MSEGARTRSDRRLLGDAGHARAMVAVMGVMLFLTVLAAALGIATMRATDALGEEIAGRLTVQVLAPGEAETTAATAALRASPDVRRITPVSRADLAALVRPWLGDAANDPDLPMPALIDVDLSDASDRAAAQVATAVRRAAPSARIDRHAAWMAPVASLLRSMIWLAFGIVVLMAGATALVVILAARSGLETHRATIGVLHMLGSTDVQVARLFQRRVAGDVLVGGVAGALLAAAVLVALGAELGRLGSGLVSGLALGGGDWLALAVLPFGFALLALAAARLTVLAELRRAL